MILLHVNVCPITTLPRMSPQLLHSFLYFLYWSFGSSLCAQYYLDVRQFMYKGYHLVWSSFPFTYFTFSFTCSRFKVLGVSMAFHVFIFPKYVAFTLFSISMSTSENDTYRKYRSASLVLFVSLSLAHAFE